MSLDPGFEPVEHCREFRQPAAAGIGAGVAGSRSRVPVGRVQAGQKIKADEGLLITGIAVEKPPERLGRLRPARLMEGRLALAPEMGSSALLQLVRDTLQMGVHSKCLGEGFDGGGPVTWHPDILERAKATGLAVEDGKLVRMDNFRMPEGMEEIEIC